MSHVSIRQKPACKSSTSQVHCIGESRAGIAPLDSLARPMNIKVQKLDHTSDYSMLYAFTRDYLLKVDLRVRLAQEPSIAEKQTIKKVMFCDCFGVLS